MPVNSGLGGANALQAPQQQGGGAVGGAQPFDLVKSVQQGYEQASAQHSKLLESMKRLEVVRAGLDSLSKLQDQVTPEDVIKTAGSMVGAGFAPQALAQLLSSMPTQGGEALQAWVQQQDTQVTQMEQSIKGPLLQTSLQRGGAAMAQLHVNHAKEKILAKRAQVTQRLMAPGSPTSNELQPEASA